MAVSWTNTATTANTCNWLTNTATSATSSSDWIDCKSVYKQMMKYAISASDLIDDFPKKLPAQKRTIELPDGAKLIIDDAGNYRIEDKDAKVTYKANRLREFSPYLNASDLLAKFVSYVGSIGVKRAEVLGLPLHLFISWLVIEAAQKDGDEIPSDIIPVQDDPMVKLAIKPKCLTCGRFIKRLHYQNRFPFCSPEHGAAYVSLRTQATLALPAPAQGVSA